MSVTLLKKERAGFSTLHYAAKWPTDAVIKTPAELTKLGAEFVDLPEGQDKERLLLELLQCFHGYLLKYVSMILHGHLPLQRNGRSKEVNKDTHLLLRCFMPREQAANRASLGAACRTLHLAFKGMDADEVYDQLMICMVKAVRRYDPYYSNKVKAAVAVLEGGLKDRKKFTASEVSSRAWVRGGLVLTCSRETRLFARGRWRRGSLLRGFEMVPLLPGRFHQLPHVGTRSEGRRHSVERSAHVLVLVSKRRAAVGLRYRYPERKRELYQSPFRPVPRPVDLSLYDLPVDIGRMTLAWVNEEQHGLLSVLSKRDRHLLYCVFVRDMDWESIASTFVVSAREAKRWYTAVLETLQEKAGISLPGEPFEKAA
ncbi:MAG: hypothetical protein M3Y72_13140 [Acidobacteriota bacterium]|nr:hypothetical protein [Acidobacteriota bacterium]